MSIVNLEVHGLKDLGELRGRSGIYLIRTPYENSDYVGSSLNLYERYHHYLDYNKSKFTFEVLKFCEPREFEIYENCFIQMFGKKNKILSSRRDSVQRFTIESPIVVFDKQGRFIDRCMNIKEASDKYGDSIPRIKSICKGVMSRVKKYVYNYL